jgi:hemoglobin/transferrin/lactoferrin receptor protein
LILLLFLMVLPAAAGEVVPTATEVGPQERASEESPATEIFDEVVVTATARRESIFDLPYSVESLNAEELFSRRQVRSVPEALREVAGVMVQKTSHGQGSPYVRGFTGFRTLMLVDGVRLNNSVMREGPNQYWNTIDPLGLEEIEVVRGSVSVLYGSDAVGGTVQAITRQPGDLQPGDLLASGPRLASCLFVGPVLNIPASGV